MFPGGKGGRCVWLTNLPPSCAVVMKSGNLKFLEPSGPLQACNGISLPFVTNFDQSQWLRSLRRRSVAVRLLRLWVRIPLGEWMDVCCECCERFERWADHSSREVLLTVMCYCVWSRKLKNEEAMTRVRQQRHKKGKFLIWLQNLYCCLHGQGYQYF